MDEMYYIISNSDGDTTVEEVSKSELLERMEENYYGSHREPLTEIPDNHDTNYWGEGILIIKGKIVTPEPIEVVKKFIIE